MQAEKYDSRSSWGPKHCICFTIVNIHMIGFIFGVMKSYLEFSRDFAVDVFCEMSSCVINGLLWPKLM